MRSLASRIGFFVSFVLCGSLATQACGGRTDEGTGDGGPGGSSSSGGGSSGASSSTSSSGGTSSSSTSSSGGSTSGGSGSSSGGSNGSSSGGPPPVCPVNPPGPGATCVDGTTCDYGNDCDSEECFCTNGYWECEGTVCPPPPPPPPPSCPSEPPGNYDACAEIDSLCDYPIENNVCNTWECDCYPSGTWNCYETNCNGFGVDAGAGGSSGGSSSSGGGQ